jgi:putative GTP pyrophosphokinase
MLPQPLLFSQSSCPGCEMAAVPFDAATFEAQYDSNVHVYRALLDEALFILKQQISSAGIKVHDIEGRLKEKPSIIKKCTEKEIANPFQNIVDLVGCRIICLFRSDMERVEKIIQQKFTVLGTDDKIQSSTDSFGYMSVHYTCAMRNEFAGPRYDAVKGIKFEIQVRTLSMHAWAAISHYLDYKGDWDVPAHLKKALNALSGLFYIADDAFERFYIESQSSRTSAEQSTPRGIGEKEEELNLDTFTAYLSRKFPHRKEATRESVSDLVKDLKASGYDSIGVVNQQVDRAADALLKYETTHHKTKSPYYSGVGAVRVSLCISSKSFREVYVTATKSVRKNQNYDGSEFRKYEVLLKG